MEKGDILEVDDSKSLENNVEVGDATSVAANDATKTATSPGTEDTVGKKSSVESVTPVSAYQIKPALKDRYLALVFSIFFFYKLTFRFKTQPVKEVIRNVMAEVLAGQSYDTENAKKWTIQIANEVNAKVKDLKMKRYKHIAQVIMGELKGAGVKCGVRCLWDSETDGYTSEIFMNVS